MSLDAMSVVDSEDFLFNGQLYLAEAFDGPSSMSYSLMQSATLFDNFSDYFQFKLAFLFPGSRFQEALRSAIYAWKYDDASRKLPLTNV